MKLPRSLTEWTFWLKSDENMQLERLVCIGTTLKIITDSAIVNSEIASPLYKIATATYDILNQEHINPRKALADLQEYKRRH